MDTTTTTMDAMHDAIVAAHRAHFGELVTQYGAYEPWDLFAEAPERVLRTPALLLEVASFARRPEPDPFGRLALDCTLGMHCILSTQTARMQQTLPQFAAAVCGLILPAQQEDQDRRANHWGLAGAVEDPDQVAAMRDDALDGLHGRGAWVVRWAQTVYVTDRLSLA